MNFKDVNFVGGKLKFKNPKIDKTIIKMKKIAKKEIEDNFGLEPKIKKYEEIINNGLQLDEEEEKLEIEERKINTENKKIIKEKESKIDLMYGFIDEINDHRTAAEKRFDAMKLKRLPEKIEKEKKVSFKNKYEEYSKNLNKLPEHYDIPKVGPG
jgi:hypothetical protein